MRKEEWDICPSNWKKNFRCWFENSGRWRLENKPTFGKWVFKIEKKEGMPNAPTFADQRNFFTGLLECEWKNDQFVFSNANGRPPQRHKKLGMFKEILDDIGERFDNQGMERGVDFYLNKARRLEEEK